MKKEQSKQPITKTKESKKPVDYTMTPKCDKCLKVAKVTKYVGYKIYDIKSDKEIDDVEYELNLCMKCAFGDYPPET